jgi:hypothetical protein
MPSIPTGVIQQFFHPPIGVCSLSLIAGGHRSGSGTLTRTVGPVGVDAFGILYSVVTEPLGAGSIVGPLTLFEIRVCQLVVRHTMLTGEVVVTEVVEGFADSELHMFTEAIPQDVLFNITPGFTVDFYWVLL